MNKSGYRNRVAIARKKRGMTQQEVADSLGVSQQAYQYYEYGQRDIKASVVRKLCSIFGCSASFLLGMDDDPGYVKAKQTPETHLLPVVGRIAAGTPREAIAQSDETRETTDETYRQHPHGFWLVVAGNSMNKVFPEDSLVLIDPDAEVRNGDIAAVFVNGDDATLKRIYFEDQSIRLVPESYDPEYPERVIDCTDPDAPELRIIGKAVAFASAPNWRA